MRVSEDTDPVYLWGLDTRPLFPTGIAAQITGIHPKTIINYENAEILTVRRSAKRRRLFSKNDLFTLLLIRYLIQERGLGFQGVKFVLELCRSTAASGGDLLAQFLSPEERAELVGKVEV